MEEKKEAPGKLDKLQAALEKPLIFLLDRQSGLAIWNKALSKSLLDLKGMLEEIFPAKAPVPVIAADPRFQLLKEFEVVVPSDYDHANRLKTFKRKHGKEFYYYNSSLTDENFDKATTRLVPGQKLKVKVFQITKSVTSVDCLEFLKTQQAILTGAQGASLAYEQGKDQLVKGRWHVSFDEKEALPRIDGHPRVPIVYAYSDGDFGFRLGYFEYDWDSDYCLLCLCD